MIELNEKYSTLGDDSRYYVVTGGRASGKSFSVNLMLVLLTYEANHTILFTRYTLTSAYVSIIPEFIEKIEMLDKFDDFHITKDEIINVQELPRDEISLFIDNMTKNQFDKLLEFFLTSPRLEYRTTYTTSDGVEREVVLTGLSDFFG